MALSKLMGRGGREEGQALMGLGTDCITDCEGACSLRRHLDQAVLLGLTSRFERAGVCSSLWGGPFSPFQPPEDSRREGPNLSWEASDEFRVSKTLGKGKVCWSLPYLWTGDKFHKP